MIHLMESDNLNLDENSFEDMAYKFEKFNVSEMDLMQFFALQLENVIAPTLKKYNLYYWVQCSNEIADQFLKNTQVYCKMKRDNDEL